MECPGVYDVIDAMRSQDYLVFSDPRGYDLNLFGIRTEDIDSNKFNDWLGVFYTYDGVWNYFCVPGTTDPGVFYRNRPINPLGTGALVEGQHRGMYEVGMHRGSYPALVQKVPVPAYRDDNKDDYLDLDPATIDVGLHGANFHRASANNPSIIVDRWSAMCQVVQDKLHHDHFMALARASVEIYGNSITYTLLGEADFR